MQGWQGLQQDALTMNGKDPEHAGKGGLGVWRSAALQKKWSTAREEPVKRSFAPEQVA